MFNIIYIERIQRCKYQISIHIFTYTYRSPFYTYIVNIPNHLNLIISSVFLLNYLTLDLYFWCILTCVVRLVNSIHPVVFLEVSPWLHTSRNGVFPNSILTHFGGHLLLYRWLTLRQICPISSRGIEILFDLISFWWEEMCFVQCIMFCIHEKLKPAVKGWLGLKICP